MHRAVRHPPYLPRIHPVARAAHVLWSARLKLFFTALTRALLASLAQEVSHTLLLALSLQTRHAAMFNRDGPNREDKSPDGAVQRRDYCGRSVRLCRVELAAVILFVRWRRAEL